MISMTTMEKNESIYAVKANDFVKDVIIHKLPCGQYKKRGGVGKYGQVHWFDFSTYEEALSEARKWQMKGYTLKHCSFCFGKLSSREKQRSKSERTSAGGTMQVIYVGDARDVLKRIKTNHCTGNVEGSALRRNVAEAMGYRLKREKRPSGSTRIRIDPPDSRQGEKRVSDYIRSGKWQVIICSNYQDANNFQWYVIEQLNPLLNRSRKVYQQNKLAPYQQLIKRLQESTFLHCSNFHGIESGPGVYVFYHQHIPKP